MIPTDALAVLQEMRRRPDRRTLTSIGHEDRALDTAIEAVELVQKLADADSDPHQGCNCRSCAMVAEARALFPQEPT